MSDYMQLFGERDLSAMTPDERRAFVVALWRSLRMHGDAMHADDVHATLSVHLSDGRVLEGFRWEFDCYARGAAIVLYTGDWRNGTSLQIDAADIENLDLVRHI